MLSLLRSAAFQRGILPLQTLCDETGPVDLGQNEWGEGVGNVTLGNERRAVVLCHAAGDNIEEPLRSTAYFVEGQASM